MNMFYSLAIFLSSFYFCLADYPRWCSDGVEHPCDYNDWDCVSRVFAQEMRCNRVRDIPDSRTINRLQLDYPSSNTSIVYHGATATGLSDFTINNFYINRKNNTLVLEVVFDLIDVESPNTDGYWYRKGKETIVTNGYCYTLYKSYSLTMTVRNLSSRSRDINDITVFTYVSDAGAPLGYSKSFEPSDPTALAEYDVFFDNLGLSLQEEAVNQGPLFMSYVLPCDMKLSRFS